MISDSTDVATFDAFGLNPALGSATQGFLAPTPVQCRAIPLILDGGDVHCIAPTGSGKTVAYALPLLSQLMDFPSNKKPRSLRVLVLVPTRELAVQVGEVFTQCAYEAAALLKVKAVYGGVSINPQMMALRGGSDVLVATPGRLLDLIAQGAVRLSEVCTVVLDEADRLLGAAFADELTAVLNHLPNDRQTLWFSATDAGAQASKLWLNQATFLQLGVLDAPVVGGAAPLRGTIEQSVYRVPAAARTQLLRHLIDTHRWPQALVFVASTHAADTVAEKLCKIYPSTAPILAVPFHAQLSQGARLQALGDFKAGRVQVLVATDLAARGLHIEGLPVVINFDLPRSTVDFTHRIGRTGRAGLPGLAISFVSPESAAHFELMVKRENALDHEVPIPEALLKLAVFAEPAQASAVRQLQTLGTDPNGGVKGRRPNKKDKLRAALQQSVQS